MNFKEAMEYLESAEIFGSKLGLDNITRLTGLLGYPQNNLKFIHVAGTNGKGSVSSFISHILTEAGYKTGLFTSPHIESFNERIIINGSEISDGDAAAAISAVKSKIAEMLEAGYSQPTEFEIVTAASLLHFSEKKCDIAVLEVGLGGRLDATNVIGVPEAAVITTIDFDHIRQLGGTIAEIAIEKAGIIKEHGDIVTCRQRPEASEAIEKICRERNAELHTSASEELVDYSLDGQIFNYDGLKGLKITLLGKHQLKNAALAVKTAELLNKKGWKITEQAIRDGLLKAKWPGRFELASKIPPVIFDGAHNPHGAAALADALTDYFGGKKVLFIMGMLADKNYEQVLDATIPLASRFFTVTPDSVRALPAETLAKIINGRDIYAKSYETVSGAISEAMDVVSENEIICCFGSLYLIGEVRNALNRREI